MIKSTEIRTWSMLGMRGTLGSYLAKKAAEEERIVALTADLCITSGLAKFFEKYPERSYNIGIAEQNMVGIAAGMADEGKIPFATTFSNFAALRSCEQVRHFMGYMQCNVKLVGIAAGYSMELFGNTHYALEDMAVVRSIPNVTLLSPADGLELVKCIDAAAAMRGPVYLRLTGVMNHPIVYKEDFEFVPGKANVIHDGKDVAIFATGSMVAPAVKAAELLAEQGIDASVVDIHTLKPLDEETIAGLAACGHFVTVEEHRKTGGLGSAVAEVVAEKQLPVDILKLGVEDVFSKAGTYPYMLEQSRLTAEMIAEDVLISLR